MRKLQPSLLLLLALAGCQSSDVSRAIGARCDLNAECDEKCLVDSHWPGGFCTLICDTNQKCGDHGVCIQEQGGGLCAFSCGSDPDCAFLGTGYMCQMVDGHTGGVKVMACRAN
ncbi:MAG: hypothetical protein JWO36_6920 [Myxococcales bacterium]|nr:hypothetical protein [Myxococcales bacterium]